MALLPTHQSISEGEGRGNAEDRKGCEGVPPGLRQPQDAGGVWALEMDPLVPRRVEGPG